MYSIHSTNEDTEQRGFNVFWTSMGEVAVADR